MKVLAFLESFRLERSVFCRRCKFSKACLVDFGLETGRLCTRCLGRLNRAVISNGFPGSLPPFRRTRPLGNELRVRFALWFRFPILWLSFCSEFGMECRRGNESNRIEFTTRRDINGVFLRSGRKRQRRDFRLLP